MIYLHTMVDLPRVFLTSEEQRKVYEVRIYETLGLVICLVHYRTWGQSPKRQNVVFSQFSTINALGERQWLPRDLIWRIKFLSKSATDLCWTDVVVQSWYCWESLGHELCVLLHIHVLQRILSFDYLQTFSADGKWN